MPLIGREKVTNRMPEDIYRAIAEPTRRIILDELVDRDGQTLYEICARLITKHGISMSRQAISQHLDVLESVGLIKTERQGRCKFHWYDGTPLNVVYSRWPAIKRGEKHED
ncbi:MAG: winged helix-turn-helix domain-containing protein [Phycisphaerae bacterium]